ncbi:MAG TPA: hypothetical protein VFV75_09550 [Candidatus Polarisedimenticolaceae bacterium]|nr:hypothetical protein [Candidatus Polarisedimenticolaceae bacterium]
MGELLYEVVRFPGKQFRMRTRSSDGQPVWSARGTRRVLYELPAVIDAVKTGKWIYVVEGEKDADAVNLRSRGRFVSTTNPGGAGKWRKEFTEVLRGGRVKIVMDMDAPGRIHAKHIATELAGVASEVRLLRPKRGKDISEHFEHGFKLHDLVRTRPRPGPGGIPQLPDRCWRGAFCDFRRATSASTEAPDEYLFAAYTVAASVAIGPKARFFSFETKANVYYVLIGESGESRKSTAMDFGQEIITEALPENVDVHAGVGSAEGILDVIDEAAEKPVLLTARELSVVLKKAHQRGSQHLIETLTELYDGARLDSTTRKHRVRVSGSYLSFFSATTPEWLRRDLQPSDIKGGFAGRLMLACGTRKPPLPFGGPRNADAWKAAVGALRVAAARDDVEVRPNPEAMEIFGGWYRKRYGRNRASKTLDVLSHRIPLFAWKMALIYCRLEGTSEVSPEQIRAACAFADYQEQLQAYVFGQQEAGNRLHDRVMRALEKHPFGLPQYRISQLVRRVPSGTLEQAVEDLVTRGVVERIGGGRTPKYCLSNAVARYGKVMATGS